MNTYQFQAPSLSRINKFLLITATSLFIFQSIFKAIGAFSLVNYLGLSASGIFSGLIYQLITYPFIDTGLMSFIFNALVVWFIGSELEAGWGEKIYVRFLLLIVISVALFHSFFHLILFHGTPNYFSPIYGLSGLNMALLVAYAQIYPDRQMSFMMIFPMKAQAFCWLLAAIEAYLALFSSQGVSWTHLLAMLLGYLVIRFQTNPVLKLILKGPSIDARRLKNAKKSHLYVIKDDDQDPPKYWQ